MSVYRTIGPLVNLYMLISGAAERAWQAWRGHDFHTGPMNIDVSCSVCCTKDRMLYQGQTDVPRIDWCTIDKLEYQDRLVA